MSPFLYVTDTKVKLLEWSCQFFLAHPIQPCKLQLRPFLILIHFWRGKIEKFRTYNSTAELTSGV